MAEIGLSWYLLRNVQEFSSLRLILLWNVLKSQGFVSLKLCFSSVWLPILLLLTYVRVIAFQKWIEFIGFIPYWILGRLNRSKRLPFGLRLTAIIIRIVDDRKRFLRWTLPYLLRHKPNIPLPHSFTSTINISHRLLPIKHNQIRFILTPRLSHLPILLKTIAEMLGMKGILLVGECMLSAHFNNY